MHGELVYREALPALTQPVSESERYKDLIDGYDYALYHPETGVLKTDPAEILVEAGIKVKQYQRDPHVLEVSPEHMNEAGVPLENFILV